MSRTLNLLRALLLVPVLLAGCQTPDANGDLRMRLRTGVVYRLVVVKVPDNIETPTRLTAEWLERSGSVRLELQDLSPHMEDLDRALARTECSKPAEETDLRLAIVFYSQDRKLAGFYYGAEGRGGQIDDKPCELTHALYSWALRHLPHDTR